MTRAALLAALAALAGCAPVHRFRDAPVVWRVADDRDIPEPADRPDLELLYLLRANVTRLIPRALALARPAPAQNVNALDEVPDSTWFTNRIGVRAVAPAEAARGPSDDPPPRPPLVVVGDKPGGETPGFLVADATGRRFIVKFDREGEPELETGGGVVLNRIFWTIGYHVPDDEVFFFRRRDLTIAADATVATPLGRVRPMTSRDVERVLDALPRLPDGRYRALASELLPGIPKGGAPAWGVRPDDPNDVIPHQHRRELRALQVFCAWTNHLDIKEENTLDMYVEEDGRRFLRHYLIDFTKFGTWGGWRGFEHMWDWGALARGLLTLGLWMRPWEDRAPAPYPAAGWFTSAPFDPTTWAPVEPYAPFHEMDRADAFWAARIVARFDRPILAAIVAEARLSDPAAAAYLVDTLLARREAVVRAHFAAVTPLHDFTIEAGRLCARDVGVVHGVARGGRVEALDADGEVVIRRAVAADGRACVPAAGGRYNVARLRIARGPGDVRPTMEVHYRGGADPRILGVIRVAE